MDADDRTTVTLAPVGAACGRARAEQPGWASLSTKARLAVFSRLRRHLAARPGPIAGALGDRPGRAPGEGLALELIPMLDAIRFLEREAAALLAPRRLGRRGRPSWLFGVEAEIRREAVGLVLVIAPSNYPLYLPGVQVLQALAAGNAVLVKPAAGCAPPMMALREALAGAGLPTGLFEVLGDDPGEARAAVEAGVDLVVLTGSAATGRRVLADLAPRLTPAILELSGNDPVFVLEGADLPLVADALAYGLRLNGGATCIAPRRAFVPRGMMAELEKLLVPRAAAIPPAPVPEPVRRRLAVLTAEARAAGARALGAWPDPDAPAMAPLVVADAAPDLGLLREDVFAPVVSLVPVTGAEEALAMDRHCPYALGASVFGPEVAARALAMRLRAGSVCINDLIVPTADPRLPFGGARESGYGATRGAEGLLALTRTKAVSLRRGRFRPHFELPRPADADLFRAALGLSHGGGAAAIGHAVRMFRALAGRRRTG
ncbi:aldehyde dehydrogenase family protein [Arenibaculum pallidiluteum]|uniref:aldehyde dehydrogenase family protein n=1 Tax=Arenibaculum pallidiluteum TaxID=2812559 RepID=UPI001A977C62|nr:aldehyde dehydrogenase family protein [Arenibaculum pallidiluteum]